VLAHNKSHMVQQKVWLHGIHKSKMENRRRAKWYFKRQERQEQKLAKKYDRLNIRFNYNLNLSCHESRTPNQ
jgi:hypothetical protein